MAIDTPKEESGGTPSGSEVYVIFYCMFICAITKSFFQYFSTATSSYAISYSTIWGKYYFTI